MGRGRKGDGFGIATNGVSNASEIFLFLYKNI